MTATTSAVARVWVRRFGAAVCAALALAWVLGDPAFPQGPILVSLAPGRGVDARDLLALPLLAAALALAWPRRSP